MAEFVYVLCAFTSILCSALTWRGYRRSASNLLFWTALCFLGFALNNIILFADIVTYPEFDLSVWRLLPAILGVCALIFGLVRKQGAK